MKKIIIILFTLLIFPLSTFADGPHYVRPVTGEYGDEDGSSYAAAFDGFTDVSWGDGDGSVGPGETLLVCGTFSGENFDIGDSGESSNVITVASGTTENGSSTNDPGVIWAGTLLEAASGWTGPDGDGIYYRTLNNISMAVNSDGEVMYSCDGEVNENTCCAGQEDSVYYDSGNIYYNPDGALKDLHVYMPYDSPIDIDGQDYITVKDLALYMSSGSGGNVMIWKTGDGFASDYITVDGCTIKYGSSFGVRTGGSSDYLTVTDSLIEDCAKGIYHTTGSFNAMTITNNEFTHTSNIDLRDSANGYFDEVNGDMCAIGVQGGGENITITDNYIHDWKGEGIFLYLSDSVEYSIDNYNISYNWIEMGYGALLFNTAIIIGGSTSTTYGNRSENGLISYNTISDVNECTDGDGGATCHSHGTAIRLHTGVSDTASNKPKIYNNMIYNCKRAFYSRNNGSESEVGVDFKNNIIHSPQASGHFIYLENSTTLTEAEFDHDIYYNTGLFRWDGVDCDDFADWQSDSSQDANSVTTDPHLSDPGNDDFELTSSSTNAIDSGVNLGESYDDAILPGSSWPSSVDTSDQDSWGSGWEISAYIWEQDYGGGSAYIQGLIMNGLKSN